MRRVKWLIQFVLYVLLGAWLHRNPGAIRFEWLGFEGETSLAFLLILGVLIWTLWSVVCTWSRCVRRVWARLWGLSLPFDMDALADRRFKVLLDEGGMYRLHPHGLGCDVGRLTDRHVRGQRTYCAKLLNHPSTAWWGYWGLIHLAYRLDDRTQAYEWASQAYKAYPRHMEMTHMYVVTSILHEDYAGALKLIPVLRRQGGCSKTQEKRLKAQLRLMQLLRHGEHAQPEDLEHVVRDDSTFEPGLRAWCLSLKHHGRNDDVVRQMRKRWAVSGGSVPLGQIYLEALNVQGVERFKAMLDLTHKGGDDDVNHTLLALEALRVGLWGEARRYIALLREHRTHPFFDTLKRLLDQSEQAGTSALWDPAEHDQHFPHLGQGPWVCASCGHGWDDQYDISCVSCGFWSQVGLGAFNSFHPGLKTLSLNPQALPSLQALTLPAARLPASVRS